MSSRGDYSVMLDMLASSQEDNVDVGQDYRDFVDDDEFHEDAVPSELLLKSLTLWSANLKQSAKRVGLLEQAIYDRGSGRPHIIACQDPSDSQIYRGLPGYEFWCSTKGIFTEEHYRCWLNKTPKNGKASESGSVSARNNPGSNGNTVDMTNIAATNTTENISSDAPNNANQAEPPQADAVDKEPKMHKVCFYVHKSIPTTSWNVLVDPNTNHGLVATLELLTASGKLAIHNVYNHEARLDIEGLFNYIPTFGYHDYDNILLGDFNFHHHAWSPRELYRSETQASRDFFNGTKECHLKLQTTPGEITFSNKNESQSSAKRSTIDLTFASNRISVRSCEATMPTGFESDHRIIETQIQQTVALEQRFRYDWRSVNRRDFEEELTKHMPSDDHPVSTPEEINEYADKIVAAMQKTIEICVRKIKIGIPVRRVNQLEKDLKSLSEKIARTSRDGTPEAEPRLKSLNRLYAKKKREIWQQFTGDPPATPADSFKLAKLGEQISQPIEPCQVPTLQHDGVTATTDAKKIALFKKVTFRRNDHPKSKRVPDLTKNDKGVLEKKIDVQINLTDERLEELIRKAPKGKSPGIDGITNEAIQFGNRRMRRALLRLFQGSFLINYHPTAFKHEILVMVRKKGRPAHDPKSWRPIALLSAIGKLQERALAQAMMAALRKYFTKLPACQFGMKTTTEAIQCLLEHVYSAQLKGLCVTIAGLDIGGAFNNVFREFLLSEMQRKNFPDSVIEFIRSFLSYSTAEFKLPGLTSGKFDLNVSIPQGSPLSCILWFIFSAIILEHLKIKPTSNTKDVATTAFAFVDDIYLIAVSDSYERNCRALEKLHGDPALKGKQLDGEELESFRGSIIEISHQMDIEFDPGKYHMMHFVKSREKAENFPKDKLVIAGFEMKIEPSMTILGVVISPNLSWEAHIHKLVTKVHQRMGYLCLISGATWGPSLKTMRTLFLTKVRPALTYAAGAWFIRRGRYDSSLHRQITNGQMEELEKAHTYCLKRISGAWGNTAAQILEKELFISDIWTELYTQATVQRAKSFLTMDQRSRPKRQEEHYCKSGRKRTKYVSLKDKGPRNPYVDLELEACSLIISARCNLEIRHLTDDRPGQAQKEWDNLDKRNRIITKLARVRASEDLRRRWREYRLGREILRGIPAGGDCKERPLPAALIEDCGKKSLGYYSNMSRAHSTILLQCRTEFIGLKARLNTNGIKNDKSGTKNGKSGTRDDKTGIKDGSQTVKTPFCRCNRGRETPYHLFIECKVFSAARELLAKRVKRMSYEDLFTKYSKVAADWALQYFDIEQFDTARARELSADFPPIEGISPARRNDDESPSAPRRSHGANTWQSRHVSSLGSDPRSQRPTSTSHSSDNATASSPPNSQSARTYRYNLRSRVFLLPSGTFPRSSDFLAFQHRKRKSTKFSTTPPSPFRRTPHIVPKLEKRLHPVLHGPQIRDLAGAGWVVTAPTACDGVIESHKGLLLLR
ncbi:zinc knuckle [Fusarium flagelliforme]|uniref:Zinc knuckle n=1 Tax=Fusarium flagelliforme TaxID=2675880 RepID=A0A395M6B8_9HYPO|nr:zinc knuckle [Fusarium flagelliforme]